MAVEFVEPIRYTQDEPQAEAAPRTSIGIRWCLVVVAIFVSSWYMYRIGAVAYSTILFLIALSGLLIGSVHAIITRPKTSDEQRKRNDLLDRWSK